MSGNTVKGGEVVANTAARVAVGEGVGAAVSAVEVMPVVVPEASQVPAANPAVYAMQLSMDRRW